ncbi:hypothetical protein K9N50_01420 [bacterium]|nr:hypothetical protein [bacterium]
MIYLLRVYWIPAFAGMMLPQALLALPDRLFSVFQQPEGCTLNDLTYSGKIGSL